MRVDSLGACPAAAPVIESCHIWMGKFTQMDMALARCHTGVHGHAAGGGAWARGGGGVVKGWLGLGLLDTNDPIQYLT